MLLSMLLDIQSFEYRQVIFAFYQHSFHVKEAESCERVFYNVISEKC